MKWNDIKNMNQEALHKALKEAQAAMVDLSFKAGAGSLKQVHHIRQKRKEITRIITMLHSLKNSSVKKDSKDKEDLK